MIDPVISYSTYLGGSGTDEIRAVAVNSAGNVYVAGTTGSLNFPTSNPQQPAMGGSSEDAFVAKLNASGTSLLYSTYLGGNGVDKAWDIEVDSSGNAYITGLTSSTNFPTTSGAFQRTGGGEKAFVVKLTPSGAGLSYSTYLGGSEGHDRGHAIALDGSNNAYVVGRTTARNFPVTIGAFRTTISGFEDAFIAKLNSTGSSLVYATFLGGSSGMDRAEAIAVDASGNAYVAGMTVSQDFPVTAGAFQRTYGGGDPFYGDAFVTKINSIGKSLVYSTYLGGINGDGAYGIALDQSGQAYCRR